LIARAARCWAISFVRVGMKTGWASEVAAHMSEIAMTAAPLPAAVRRCLDKLSPVVLDSVPDVRRTPIQ
jgi:hypothetical protein